MNAILNTEAGPNLIHKGPIPWFYWHKVSEMKPKQFHSAVDTLIQITGSIRLVMKLGQQVIKFGFLVVKNLVVDMLLSTAFIAKNIYSI